MSKQEYSRFRTELHVRPDDIDMFQHVHSSRYLDYVLAARYDQMERCYRMPMEEFLHLGFGWVIRAGTIRYKRPLGLGEKFVVETWIEEFVPDGVTVGFNIVRSADRKLSCEGSFDYAMVRLDSGRAEKIPEWIVEKYSI